MNYWMDDSQDRQDAAYSLALGLDPDDNINNEVEDQNPEPVSSDKIKRSILPFRFSYSIIESEDGFVLKCSVNGYPKKNEIRLKGGMNNIYYAQVEVRNYKKVTICFQKEGDNFKIISPNEAYITLEG